MKTVTIVLTGSIASIKYNRIINILVLKYNVNLIFTKSAQMFINQHDIITNPSINKVYSDEFSVSELKNIDHINLSKETDLLLVAPCSYDYLNKITNGIADSFSLSLIAAISKEKIMIAPAMNTNMYNNIIFQKNMEKLLSYGINIIYPDTGLLSCGDIGIGKLAKIKDIAFNVDNFFHIKNKKKIIVTGGSTKLYIDPIRYISNESSGIFSKCIVNDAIINNFEVHYIHGENVKIDDVNELAIKYLVKTNEDLIEAIRTIKSKNNIDAIIMNAAPIDYHFKMNDKKIKTNTLELNLVKSEDIIKQVSGIIKFGFALETNDHIKNGYKKLKSKNLDFIMINDAKTMSSKIVHKATILSKNEEMKLDNITKEDAAKIIVKLIKKDK